MTAMIPTNGSTSLFASAGAAILSLPNLKLADDEQAAFSWLMMRLFEVRPYLELRNLYYDGLQQMQDLGISIPPSLSGLRTVIGWPQIGIDAIDERCQVEGFRYPGKTTVDDDLLGTWQANNLDGEGQLAQIDALIYGRSYLVVGPNDEDPKGPPLITAESPINMIASWDARKRRATAALQMYLDTNFVSDTYGQQVAALYLPGKTIYMSRNNTTGSAITGTGDWEIFDRDDHGLNIVPVVRMANRQRLSNRGGLSEITPAWMNTTDSACRTLLGMEVKREFYGAPRRYILGASEEAFQKADGTPISAWESYLQKMFAIPYDEDGNIPQVGQFPEGDPSTMTKMIDSYTQIMSGLTALPPSYLGQDTQGNPASADAIRSAVERLVRRCGRKMIGFGEAYEEAQRYGLLIRDGKLPDGAERIETDWVDPNPQTIAQTTDAIAKQIEAGAIPATSDVTLKRLGWSPVERARLAEDRKNDDAQRQLDELAHQELLKTFRAANAVQGDEQKVAAPAAGPAPAAPKKQPIPAPPAAAR